VYVSLYDEGGNLAGQSGSHVPVGPLEESIRRFAFEAVQQAKPKLTRENFSKYVVDVSVPYGFSTVDRPEQMLPFLNGVIMHNAEKTSAWHPDAWRIYPDAHQILAEICARLGLRPWTYANGNARIETFRVLAFNEKEPFQDLGAASRKKKKKTNSEDSLDSPDGGGGTGGFTF
jgi:AMMECR1 domain-containing protein